MVAEVVIHLSQIMILGQPTYEPSQSIILVKKIQPGLVHDV